MSNGLTSVSFPKNARAALANPPLLKAIAHIEETLVSGRRRAATTRYRNSRRYVTLDATSRRTR